MRFLRKMFVCWWGGCGMVQRDDNTHIWGECLRCGKVAGIVSREALRRLLDAHAAQREAEVLADFDRRCIERKAKVLARREYGEGA